jgi:hypothetical protein
MSDASTKIEQDAAFALVGEFLFHWAGVESTITEGIADLLQLPEPQADIILANVSFRDKTSMAKTLIHHTYTSAKSDDNTIKAAHALFDAIISFSGNYRNVLMHNPFVPLATGGIEIFRVRAKGKYEVPKTIWDNEFLEERLKELEQFQTQLNPLFSDLEKKWIGVMEEVVRKMTTSSSTTIYSPPAVLGFAAPIGSFFGPNALSSQPTPPQANTGSPHPPTNPVTGGESPPSRPPKE